jgi:L-2-hydroxyglutarate oxidase LhgO
MTQAAIQLPGDLYEAVLRRATSQKTTPEALVVEWVSAQVAPDEAQERKAALEREMAAFERLKPELLKQYAGRYVGVYQEMVAAVGDSRLEAVKAIYAQFGQVVCFVEKVSPDPPRRVRIPSIWKAK